MFKLILFIIPSLFIYLGYIKSKKKKHLDVFSQWIFISILLFYSLLFLSLYFFIKILLFKKEFFYKLTLYNLSEYIEQILILELFFVCLLSYFFGKLIFYLADKFSKLNWIDLFIRIDPEDHIESILKKAISKKPVILFLSNGDVHIGIPSLYESRSNGVIFFNIKMILSGHKKEGQVSYKTDYYSNNQIIYRTFYVRYIASLGLLEDKTFVYFLKNKPDEKKTEVEKKWISSD